MERNQAVFWTTNSAVKKPPICQGALTVAVTLSHSAVSRAKSWDKAERSRLRELGHNVRTGYFSQNPSLLWNCYFEARHALALAFSTVGLL
jgi:hypothetical protein